MALYKENDFGIFDIEHGSTGGKDTSLMCSIIGLYKHARQQVQEYIEKDKREGNWKDDGDATPVYMIRVDGLPVYSESPANVQEW